MTIPDNFPLNKVGLDSPYTNGVAVTPHDTNDLAFRTRAIYIGGAGNVTATLASGVDVLFTAVPVGTTLRVRADKVKSTGTTATAIVALE